MPMISASPHLYLYLYLHLILSQSRLGIEDQVVSVASQGAVEVQAAEPVKEKEVWDLKLTVVDAKAKIKIIKEVRTITGLGLKEVCLLLSFIASLN